MTEIKLNTDQEGFITQECPACGHRFKVSYGREARLVMFCPYCRHEGTSWWTRPQASYIEANEVVKGADQLERMLTAVLKGSNPITPKGGAAPSEPDEPWAVVEFPSKERVKHDGSKKSLYCP